MRVDGVDELKDGTGVVQHDGPVASGKVLYGEGTDGLGSVSMACRSRSGGGKVVLARYRMDAGWVVAMAVEERQARRSQW